ncbi:MAG TPA: hypothetical protein VJM15_03695 [Sphingomicrobium sp.]|nr:hypothetical protein [Sphingomicrobium sp.]
MARETRVTFGPVPHTLLGEPLGEMSWQMLGDQFVMRGEGDHYFHYRKGHGITTERGEQFDLSEESLWLNGSVYAAIASLNGFLPIHASAVAHNDQVFAFTGPAGAGKSTVVAALGKRGLPMFCDDTLVLDLSDPDQIHCLPGHKRLKLRPDAVELTGATPQEKVSKTVDKHYALPAAGDVRAVLPLGQLLFLENGSRLAIEPLTGSERFVMLQDDHQTAHLFAGARRFDRKAQFEHLARLARQIEMARFVRPYDVARFDEGVALAAEHVTKGRS